MFRFHARTERDTTEAGLHSRSWHVSLVQHIAYAVLHLWPIDQDTSPLLRCGIQRWRVVHSTERCRWSDLEWALPQRWHRGTQTHIEAVNQKRKFWTSIGGVIGWPSTSGASKASEDVTRIAALETSLGDGWKPQAEGSCRNRAGKHTLADTAQLPLKDEEFEDMIPI